MSKEVIVRDLRINGVFALKDFREGGLVLEIDDSHPVPDRSRLTPNQSKYKINVFIGKDGKRKVVFAPSPERCINHWCDSNVYVKTDLHSGIRMTYALREICTGEEITRDHFVNTWEEWEVHLEYNCGSSNCRRILGGNFFVLPKDIRIKWFPMLNEPFKRKFKDRLNRVLNSRVD